MGIEGGGGAFIRLINKEMGKSKIYKKNWQVDGNEDLIVLGTLKKEITHVKCAVGLGLSSNIRVIKKEGDSMQLRIIMIRIYCR